MTEPFDADAAKKYLFAKEKHEQQLLEEERKRILHLAISALKEEFKNSEVEVYLIGSILQPFGFSSISDIDIVLKNFQGDRFDSWTKLEHAIGRQVEIILFETCHFQEFILQKGLRVK